MSPGRDGKPELRSLYGKDVCLPACRTPKGCPKGTPEKPKNLSAENRFCWQHYKECRAIGLFPDDAVVRRNAALIRELEDLFERHERKKELFELMSAVLTTGM